MEFGGASSLVLLLAVGLWVAYLVPSIVRRRNEESTERNAVRLQQALRALAETAEAPTVMRAETTPRGVAEQQRRLKRTERERARAQAAAEKAERRATRSAESVSVPDSRHDTLNPASFADGRRRAAATRRGRLATTCVLVAGAAAAIGGGVSGAGGGSWWVCIAGLVAVIAAIGMLQQLARVSAAQRSADARRAAMAAEAPTATVRATRVIGEPLPWLADQVAEIGETVESTVDASAAETTPVPGWTPVPLPTPLYLRAGGGADGPDGGPGGPGGGERPAAVNIEALRAAARASEQAIRDAHRAPGVATFGPIAVAHAASVDSAAATQPLEREALLEAVYLEPIEAPSGRLGSRPSRWERMGLVDDRDFGRVAEAPVLRRRAG